MIRVRHNFMDTISTQSASDSVKPPSKNIHKVLCLRRPLPSEYVDGLILLVDDALPELLQDGLVGLGLVELFVHKLLLDVLKLLRGIGVVKTEDLLVIDLLGARPCTWWPA